MVTTTWDPKTLTRFREEFGLSKMDLLREMQAHGLRFLNYGTLHRWEGGNNVPRPAYEDTILRTLEEIRKKFEAEGVKKKRPRGRK